MRPGDLVRVEDRDPVLVTGSIAGYPVFSDGSLGRMLRVGGDDLAVVLDPTWSPPGHWLLAMGGGALLLLRGRPVFVCSTSLHRLGVVSDA